MTIYYASPEAVCGLYWPYIMPSGRLCGLYKWPYIMPLGRLCGLYNGCILCLLEGCVGCIMAVYYASWKAVWAV